MKNGLIFEDGHLIYYRKDRPYHAGVVKVDGDIYYISKGGRAVKGEHIVHGEMTNDILKRGTYTFGDDYKLVKGSYIAPKNKSKKSKSKKSKKDDKKKFRILVCSGIIMVLLLSVVGVDMLIRNFSSENISSSENADRSVSLPDYDEEVLICSEKAKELYDNKITVETALKGGNPYKAFVFEYDLNEREGNLLISENEDLSDSIEVVLPANEYSVSIDNLKTDTTYYYQVSVDSEYYKGRVKTAKSTRFINISGLYNTRDIGGYVNLDGKTVKQGLLIRGTELDGLVEPGYFLEDDTVEYVRDTFGFVCDFDLREKNTFTGEYVSQLGADVNHIFFEGPMYGAIFNADGNKAVKEIFSNFAKPENYPMYLHCTYGADRTGTMVFLLQGLLNMHKDDMIREYHMTGFHLKDYASATSMNGVIKGLENYKGSTINEQIENYMLDIGVSKEEIQSIRDIFLED